MTMVMAALALQLHAQQQMYVGGDISVLQSYEDNNVAYYDDNGQKIDDVLKYMIGRRRAASVLSSSSAASSSFEYVGFVVV